MFRGPMAALAAMLVLLAPIVVAAQTVRPAAPYPPPSAMAGQDRMDRVYRGVVPGARHRPPRARHVLKSRRNLVTWPGFEATGSGSRFFVQTTRPVEFSRADEPHKIVVVLANTRIHLWNNRNPLVTEHFNTPVARAYLRRQRRNTLLVLEMKADVQPHIRQVTEGEYHYLFVEFPGGTYAIPQGAHRGPRQWHGAAPAQKGDVDERKI